MTKTAVVAIKTKLDTSAPTASMQVSYRIEIEQEADGRFLAEVQPSASLAC